MQRDSSRKYLIESGKVDRGLPLLAAVSFFVSQHLFQSFLSKSMNDKKAILSTWHLYVGTCGLPRSSMDWRDQCFLARWSNPDRNQHTYFRVNPSIRSLVIITHHYCYFFLNIRLIHKQFPSQISNQWSLSTDVLACVAPASSVAHSTPYITVTCRDVLSLVSFIENTFKHACHHAMLASRLCNGDTSISVLKCLCTQANPGYLQLSGCMFGLHG